MANDGKMKLKAMLLTHSSSEIHSRKLQNFGDAFSHLASEQVCLAWSRTSSPRVKSASSMSKNQVSQLTTVPHMYIKGHHIVELFICLTDLH
ncbi:uncharacterized protein LOC131244459 isoform X2 [Magnolia sinica]|uniref:uncharacterized protein LOC131244459 isoform X2 n=1 Tax=Magnolia sinica TaxID=86752 RepID=UPI002659DE3B|nr:uncharacterized protein LOC131244459 isoform X2 [Magnolia sinica]